jgi:hypothetical protein
MKGKRQKEKGKKGTGCAPGFTPLRVFAFYLLPFAFAFAFRSRSMTNDVRPHHA